MQQLPPGSELPVWLGLGLGSNQPMALSSGPHLALDQAAAVLSPAGGQAVGTWP